MQYHGKNNIPLHLSAEVFLNCLSNKQVHEVLSEFDNAERFNWYFTPKKDRKGLYLNFLTQQQKQLGFDFLKRFLSEKTYYQILKIINLEVLLHKLEKRNQGNWYRDPGNYAFIFFSWPSLQNIWAWRFEGHHISLNFTVENNNVVSCTPHFLGANPAIQFNDDREILIDERNLAFLLINSLSKSQITKTLLHGEIPDDIVTFNNRKATINDSSGIHYREMEPNQQILFKDLLNVYICRFNHKIMNISMQEIICDDIDSFRFAWAGALENKIGEPFYYRILNQNLIIELANIKNNGNHIHSVIRNATNDFGGR